MNRRTLLLLVTCGLGVLLVVLVWILAVGFPPERIALNDADVDSVAAEVFAVDVMGTDHIPPFTVPREYHSQILNALRPIVRTSAPAWGELDTVAKLSILNRDGSRIDVVIPMGGQNRIHFKLNGDWCIREGRYEPVYDIVLENGPRMGYADESLLLYDALRQIHRKVAGEDNDAELVESFEDLQRTAGKRPPRLD